MTNSFTFDLSTLPSDKITLFDIRYDVPPDNTISPWSWTVKYALYLKNIPFHIELVEMVDIPDVSQSLGLQPGEGYKPEPMYMLPAIYDPATKIALADSLAINTYLDSQYPQTPRVVSDGTTGLIRAFLIAIKTLDAACFPLTLERCLGLTTTKSREHFRTTRERVIGMKIEDITPKGQENIDAAWAGVKKVFDTIDSWFGQNSFIMGTQTPTHADMVIAGRLILLKRLLREESEEWRCIETWNDGRWGRLLAGCNTVPTTV